ncbi:TPA: hypothetical protein DEP58_03125 [Patescibacteria group bacterium]|nr:MAG: hypothetical protein UU98_C0018G0026 [Parcubacteria group bacterium GW2011_GWD2_42_14]HCC05274.1 hypothetical protein [Patescibacteria group bacterium]
MESKTNNTDILKATERINKLCSASRSLSEKDIKALSYIVEKTSRIATVSFLLADVLDENEELKIELKKSGIGLLKDVTQTAHSTQKRETFLMHLLELVVLLDTGARGGLLSRMNTDTLSDEITSLSELIEAIDWQSGRRFVEESLFGGNVPRELFDTEPRPTRSESFERHAKDMHSQSMSLHDARSDSYTQQTVKDTMISLPSGRVQYKERVQEVQKDRRATILGLVQKKDKITVRDVSNVIKDCSEKTIQRELLALVKQGVLVKEGERRWSTYSLA